ncbi:MAG: hypothetical protein R2771_06690 [Saprospiraceae bacterium]
MFVEFGKFNPELIDFINNYKINYGIPLDPIYTGKLAFALNDLIMNKYFEKGSTIVMIHGGGLQGISGFNQLNNELIK